MRRLIPLSALVLVVLDGPPARACIAPDMDPLAARAQHVVLARVVARHEADGTRVVELEVTRVFKGDPPGHFAVIDPSEFADGGPDEPAVTDSGVLFLDDEPFLSAPWHSWEEVTRLTAGMTVLGVLHWEPVLHWRGQLVVVKPMSGEPPPLLAVPEPQAPVIPIDEYLRVLGDAIERAAAEAAPR